MAHVSAKSVAATQPGQPTEGVRTLVSFLIFVHLFALIVGVLANEVPSKLEVDLGSIPGLLQYRQALGMDLPYSYNFTRGNDPGGELDIDYTLTATVKKPDGEAETVTFPSADMWPHQRYHRYQILARHVAEFSSEGTPDPANLETLAQAIAGGILRSQGAKALDLLCRGQLTPPGMDEYQPNPNAEPRTRDAYDTRAFLVADQVELLKKEPARDTAPPAKLP